MSFIKKCIFALLVASMFHVPRTSARMTYTSTTCTEADIASKMASASADGDIVFLDCASKTWTSEITWSPPANATLMGRGCAAATGGGDLTVITDNFASGDPLLIITPNATGTFRLCGMTFIAGTSSKTDGVVAFGGQSGSTRVDHLHFDAQTNATLHNNLQFTNYVRGVVDHCIFDLHSTGNGIRTFYKNYGNAATDSGDHAFAAATGFGSADFIVIEDNIFNGNSRFSAVNDIQNGGKNVIRFNTINKAWIQTHPSRSGYGRGGRATEVYLNAFVSASGAGSLSSPHSEAFYHDSGPALVWGNTAPVWYASFHNAHSARRSWDTNPQHREGNPPTGWGWGGPPVQSGTVTVDGTGLVVTKTAGTNFNTSWAAGDMIYIGTTTTDAARIATVTDTTHLTLTDAVTPGAGQAYTVGSNWDGNSDIYGYPHLDQPGRGVGDLIRGEFTDSPSGKINDATGCDSSMSCAWPRQVLEPLYDFLNTWVAVPDNPGFLFNGQTGILTQNQDYYLQDDTNCAPSAMSCTEGVGVGTLAQRPGNCTVGVAYFAKDQGAWRTATPSQGITTYTDQGRLYTCTATNTWSLYYTPLNYPHPLVSGGSAVSTGGTNRLRMRIR